MDTNEFRQKIIPLSNKLLRFTAKLDKSNPENSKMLANLTEIRILSTEDKNKAERVDFYKELKDGGFFRNNRYESLMDITESNN
jgi:hypothetical protein